MSILEEIVSKKRQRLREAISRVSLRELESLILETEPPRDFKGAIKRADRIRLIAEIKKASPSRGLIRADFDPEAIAVIYSTKADAISVLTEEDFFLGSPEYIKKAKSASGLPILRKDFIFDPYQIYEARAIGADAVLLIAACLEPLLAKDLYALSKELGLSVLFEIHDIRELDSALKIGVDIIGINNRDLRTMKTDISTTIEAKKEIPPDRIVVSESGIRSNQDIQRLSDIGIDAVLIGTAFMEAKDIGAKIDEVMGLK